MMEERAFESEVLAYFRAAFHDYCERAHHDARLELRGSVIQAQLVTVRVLRHVAPQIRRQATTFARRLAGAERVELRFPVLPQLPAPGYRLDVAPRLPGAGPAADPDPALVLRLSYGTAARWDFPLPSGPYWVPLGRDLPHQRGFVIPEATRAVPRGGLLEVRHLLGETELCRSELRPEYTVEVDGHLLAPGYLIAVTGLGTIVYSRTGADSATRLHYQVERKV
jgi:hypothetical protein